MIDIVPIKDVQSKEDTTIQKTILNSHPAYNQVVMAKELLSEEDSIKDNEENLKLGAEYYYITKDNEPVGLIHYLLKYKSDNLPWIGLLIVHKQHSRGGIASQALHLLEKKLIDQNNQKVKLCVQEGNEIGAAFWRQKGFVIINSATDGHNNRVDIYEKKL